jgi:hypothetical protein
MLESKALAASMALVMREHLGEALAPLIEENRALVSRIASLEGQLAAVPGETKIASLVAAAVAAIPPMDVAPLVNDAVSRAVAALPPPKDGASIDPMVVRAMIDEAVAALPPAAPGKDADPDLIRSFVDAAVSALPPAEPGKDADVDLIRSMVNDAVSDLPPAEPGKDADPSAIRRMVDDAVAAIELPQPRDPIDADIDQIRAWILEAVQDMPKPADGKSITPADVAPMIMTAVNDAVAGLPPAKDGIGLAGALIGRDGDLVVTLTDGSVRALGPVVGRDYDPAALDAAVKVEVARIPVPRDGDPGKDADPDVIRRMVAEAVAELPPPANGKDAYPGQARGLYDPAATYRALDVVGFNGSEWRAKVDGPGELPGEDWMLSAQRGKPGKPGEVRAAPPGAEIIAAYVDAKDLRLILTKDDGSELKVDLHDLAATIRNA